jgi:hypothetical protein
VHLEDLVGGELRQCGAAEVVAAVVADAGEDLRQGHDDLADITVGAEHALYAKEDVEAAAARGRLGGGRDREPERGVPGRVAATLGVRRGALPRDRVAGDGGNGVHRHACDQVDVLQVLGRQEGDFQHSVRHG